MVDLSGFDASQVEPASVFEPIPAGKYEAMIIDSVSKPTRSGTGNYLELTFQITGGEYAKRILWSRLNLSNPNPQAVQIAQADLSAICRAVGVMAPQDSSELHDLPMVITVACKRREDNGDIVNEIRGYATRDKPAATASGNPQSTPPWKQSKRA